MDRHDALIGTAAAHHVMDQHKLFLHAPDIPEMNSSVFKKVIKVCSGCAPVKMKPVKGGILQRLIAVRAHTVQKYDIFFPGNKRAPLIFEEQFALSDKKQEKRFQTGPADFISRAAGVESFKPDIKEIILCKCSGSVDKNALCIKDVLLHLDYVFFRDLPHNCSLPVTV